MTAAPVILFTADLDQGPHKQCWHQLAAYPKTELVCKREEIRKTTESHPALTYMVPVSGPFCFGKGEHSHTR